MENSQVVQVPDWVPEGAQRYLAHTESGRSIRDLARVAGCHASTVLRQIRRIETRRDDPLVDAALCALAQSHFHLKRNGQHPDTKGKKDQRHMANPSQTQTEAPDEDRLEHEAVRVLPRLCETGAVLAVAENMDKAVVVRDQAGASARTATVDCAVAQAMALNDWITCVSPGRISRYHITASGRSALSRMIAQRENRARSKHEGFAEAQTPFGAQHRVWDEKTVEGDDEKPRRIRYNVTESPLTALARRKDRDGQPFIEESLVRAGERLREDFELAQMGTRVTQNWDRFLTGGGRGTFSAHGGIGMGPADARDRVARALSDLGPGLSDVALRCCCYLEGLETAEKNMGWSARSGKIVLRIALQRLRRHYERLEETGGNLIG